MPKYYTSKDLVSTSQGYRDPVTGALMARGGIAERDDAWEDEQGVWHLGLNPDQQAAADAKNQSRRRRREPTPEPDRRSRRRSRRRIRGHRRRPGPPRPPGISTVGGGFTVPPPASVTAPTPGRDLGTGTSVPAYVPDTPVFTPPAYVPPPAFAYDDFTNPGRRSRMTTTRQRRARISRPIRPTRSGSAKG